MSLKISIIMMFAGFLIMGTGVEIMFGGFVILQFTDLTREYSPEMSDEIETLVELRKQIELLLQKQSFELTRSEGLTWVGTGAAMTIAGFPIFLNGRKEISEYKQAKNFLNDDFQSLHNKMSTVIRNLEEGVKDLKTNNCIVDDLIKKKYRSLDLIKDYITRLSFSLWDSVMDQFKHFTKEEQKILKDIHEFILDSNGFIVPRDSSLVSEVNEILKSNSSNMKQELTDRLLEVFEGNLYNYKLILKTMHCELDSIKWIENNTWDKKINITNTQKKLVIDKKGTFWHE